MDFRRKLFGPYHRFLQTTETNFALLFNFSEVSKRSWMHLELGSTLYYAINNHHFLQREIKQYVASHLHLRQRILYHYSKSSSFATLSIANEFVLFSDHEAINGKHKLKVDMQNGSSCFKLFLS